MKSYCTLCEGTLVSAFKKTLYDMDSISSPNSTNMFNCRRALSTRLCYTFLNVLFSGQVLWSTHHVLLDQGPNWSLLLMLKIGSSKNRTAMATCVGIFPTPATWLFTFMVEWWCWNVFFKFLYNDRFKCNVKCENMHMRISGIHCHVTRLKNLKTNHRVA